MQILAETEYQDVYRVTDGVLLIVNKFKPIDYETRFGRYVHCYLSDKKLQKYNKGCQYSLKVLKNTYYDEYADIKIPKGTVMYYNQPVEIVNESDYEYQIKTTGDAFKGDVKNIEYLLRDILYRVKNGKCLTE